MTPGPVYRDRRFHASHRRDLSPVTWWALRRHGLALFGPAVEDLPCKADRQAPLRHTVASLDGYWRAYTRVPRRVITLVSDRGVQWAVLGMSRLVITLRDGDVPGKTQVAKEMLARAPAVHRRALGEALRLRQQMPGGLYLSRLARARAASAFVDHAAAAGHRDAAGPTLASSASP